MLAGLSRVYFCSWKILSHGAATYKCFHYFGVAAASGGAHEFSVLGEYSFTYVNEHVGGGGMGGVGLFASLERNEAHPKIRNSPAGAQSVSIKAKISRFLSERSHMHRTIRYAVRTISVRIN